SGARVGRVIHTSSIFCPSSLGAVILVSIIKRDFNRKRIRLGQVFRALVIGRGFNTRRIFGQSVYSSNTLVLIKRSEIVPVSKRINGPVPLELRKRKLLKFLAMGTYVFLSNNYYISVYSWLISFVRYFRCYNVIFLKFLNKL